MSLKTIRMLHKHYSTNPNIYQTALSCAYFARNINRKPDLMVAGCFLAFYPSLSTREQDREIRDLKSYFTQDLLRPLQLQPQAKAFITDEDISLSEVYPKYEPAFADAVAIFCIIANTPKPLEPPKITIPKLNIPGSVVTPVWTNVYDIREYLEKYMKQFTFDTKKY